MKCPKCGGEMVGGDLRVRGTCGYCWEIEWYENSDSPPRPFRPATLKIKDMEARAFRRPSCEVLLLEYRKGKKMANKLRESDEMTSRNVLNPINS